MNDETIESVFREELKRHGERWGKQYKNMSDEFRMELLGKMAARRLVSEARDAEMQSKKEAEEFDGGPTCGTLQSGTGGGHRRIEKGSPFS